MHKKTLIHFVALLGLILCSSACVRDSIIDPQEEVGEEVYLSLECLFPKSKDIVLETKSYSEESSNAEKALYNLYIYIFSDRGVLTGYKHLDKAQLSTSIPDNTDPYQGYKYIINDIKTVSGLSRICAVANLETNTYNLDPADLAKLTTDNEGPSGIAGSALTLNDLYSILYSRAPGDLDILDNRLMFSGFLNGGDLVYINHNQQYGRLADITDRNGNQLPSYQKEILLSSIVSKNTINIDGDNFTPEYYEIHNVPLSGRLMPIPQRYTPLDPTLRYEDLHAKSIVRDEPIVFYLPQNLAGESTENITKWSERETNSYNGDIKTFDYAPEHSTYIVIHGKYSGAEDNDYAQASFTIHLGDFGTNLKDYNVNRHGSYHYNVHITAVDEIIVEAMTEYQDNPDTYRPYWNPGAEGVVISPNAINPIHLDCHYEARALSFNLAEAHTQNTQEGGYIMRIDTFFDKTPALIVQDVAGVGTIYDAAELKTAMNHGGTPRVLATIANDGSINGPGGTGDGLSAIFSGKNGAAAINDYQWIKIMKNTQANIITQSDVSHDIRDVCAYPGDNSPELMNIFQFLWQLYKDAEDPTKNGTIGDAQTDYYTFFFDENYYPNKSWAEYTNTTDKRYLFLTNKYFESADEKSVYAIAKYVFEQECIWTFYDPDEADNIVAYGKEVFNEDEPFNLHTDADVDANGEYDIPLSLRVSTQNFDSNWDGYTAATFYQNGKSFKSNNVKGESATADANNSYTSQDVYRKISQVCMSRNRDANGDGTISADEIHWYVPTIDQATGLFIGDDIYAGEAKTFNKFSFDLINNEYKAGTNANLAAAAYHYYTASKLNVFWAEEGAATSMTVEEKDDGTLNKVGWSMAEKVRCVRSLESGTPGAGEDGIKNPDRFFTSEQTTIDGKTFTDITLHVDSRALRVTKATAPLKPSYEREAANRAHKRFRVADANIKDGNKDKIWSYNEDRALFEDITDVSDDQCFSSYGGIYPDGVRGWRVPNMRELSLMESVMQISSTIQNGFLWCNTVYTGFLYDFGRDNNKHSYVLLKAGKMTVTPPSDGNLRCVRDL